MHQMRTGIFIAATVLLLLGLPPQAPAQESKQEYPLADSSGKKTQGVIVDSAAAAKKDSVHADSLHVIPDTLGRMSTPSLVGTLDRTLDTAQYVTQSDIHWIDFEYIGSILETFSGVYIRDQASAGQYNQINIRGQDWRSVAVLQNGRLLNDPASGIYNLYQYSTEYADRIELITGPRAFLYGLNSTGGAVNIVTRNYNSNRPFTKLNYSEGPYGYALTDGTFSQNISRKVNLTLGFQFQGVDGRFLNSLSEAWNVRAKVRYNVSKDLNIILSDYFTSSKTDLNGGVDPSKSRSPFDPLMATVRNAESYDKITRHDLDLSVVGTFLSDTTNVTTLNFYYSNNFRQYRDEDNRYSSYSVPADNMIFIHSDHTSSWMGGTLSQNYDTEWQRFSAALNLELRQVEGSPNIGRRRNVIASGWGKEELLLGEYLTLAGFGRIDEYLDHRYVGAGADATLKLGHAASLFGGFSFSRRVPNYMELYWTDSTVTRPQDLVAEQHREIEVGTQLTWAGSDLRLAYFHRTVQDPMLFQLIPGSYVFPSFSMANGGSIATNGIEARLRLRVWMLYLEANTTYLIQRQSGADLAILPKLALSGGIYFWNKLLNDHLELKTGIRGQYQSSQNGETFNPEALAYVSNAGTHIGYASVADFFLIAHIGDAYVHFIWENLLNIQYYCTPYYPGGDRAIRFGISWEFWN
jgi:outer membrane cobalamin receptor